MNKEQTINNDIKYISCIKDIISHKKVVEMSNFIQHRNVNTLQHCLGVSYRSYVVCKWLNLDYHSAARGGLLHDFFLYDWHCDKPYKGLHGTNHAGIALDNACHYFKLNDIEKDIIKKHMWPLNLALPKYPETVVIVLIDKYCAVLECLNI